MRVILENQAPTGAYVASPNFSVYRYSWLRDGAFIADAMSRAGQAASAEAFFGWCARLLVSRAEKIESLIARHRAGQAIPANEFLHARYTVDGKEGVDDWWNFQLDGYGTWLWALGSHLRRNLGTLAPYGDAVTWSAKYLIEFWAQPSYDWWEEALGHRHTSTLASLYAGLREVSQWQAIARDLRREAGEAAARIRETILTDGRQDGHLVKWLGGDSVDASLLACGVPFAVLPATDPLMATTVRAIEGSLAHGGGVHRYAQDTYYGGGEWPVLSAFLGWHYLQVGRTDAARAELAWIVDHATASGDLPEQVADHLLAPTKLNDWIARWGPVATPLLWSHAMFLTLALELGEVSPPIAPAR